jgi:hypothetical protein
MPLAAGDRVAGSISGLGALTNTFQSDPDSNLKMHDMKLLFIIRI